MAKNLYRFYCPLNSEYDYETLGQNKKVTYVDLYPLEYTKKIDFKTEVNRNAILKTNYNIYNQKLFWQTPQDE
jgi:hypothetical protein